MKQKQMAENHDIPTWRRAVRMFLREGFAPGDTVSHEFLFDAFEIDKPTGKTPKELADAAQFEYLEAFKPFSEHLLVEHKIALDAIRGVGYRIVPAPEQVEWAETEGRKQIQKALHKRSMRIAYVDTSQLDDLGRQQRSDAMARTGRMRTILLVDSGRTIDIKSYRNVAAGN